MNIQVYFTYKPHKDGFTFDQIDEPDFCYINMLNATNEEIIEYNNNIDEDKGLIVKSVLFIIDKRSFEDHTIKLIYVVNNIVTYYTCFRTYLDTAYMITCNLETGNLSFEEAIQSIYHAEDNIPIPFHLLE